MNIIQKRTLLIFFCLLFLFTIFLPPEFIAFQTRFGLFAQEMFRHGITFFPQTYMGAYPDYPISSTILIYLVSLLFGHVSTFTAILPTAIISSLTLVLIYRIGALENEMLGMYAVWFALFTQYFIEESRTISLDQYTTFFTALSFYLVYSADILNRFKRLGFLPLVLLLGFAFRGPIGLVIPAGVLAGYYVYRKEYVRFFKFGIMTALVLLIALLALFGSAYLSGGKTFVKYVLAMQFTDRMNGDHADMFYYFTSSFLIYFISFPAAVLVIIARYKNILRPKTSLDRLLGYLTVWFLIILIGMTIPSIKKARYILPIVPAISLMAASIFIENHSGWFYWAKKCILKFCAIFPYLAALLSLSGYFYISYFPAKFIAPFTATMLVLYFLIFISQIFLRKFKNQKEIIKVGIAALTLVILNIGIATPLQYHHEKTKPFVDYYLTLPNQPSRDLVFYQDGPDGDDIKFMVNLNQPIKPVFINSIDQLMQYPKPAYFIAKKETTDQMPPEQKNKITILYQGNIGHRPSVIFEKLKI